MFLLDLHKIIVNQLLSIFMHSISLDEILENLSEISRILVSFYTYCKDNNYELAIVIISNDFYFLSGYLEYYNYNITYHNNNWITLDNNTGNMELNNLISILLQIADIAKTNISNMYLYNWGGQGGEIYKKIVFIDGKLEVENIDIEYLDSNKESDLMVKSYYLIGDILCLQITRDFANREIYETVWNEIIEKNMEMEDEMVWTNKDDYYDFMKNYLLNYINSWLASST